MVTLEKNSITSAPIWSRAYRTQILEETEEWLRQGGVLLPKNMERESKEAILVRIALLRKRKSFIQLDLPDIGFSKELLRVPRNAIHGEIVVTLSSEGRIEVIVYENEELREELQLLLNQWDERWHTGLAVQETEWLLGESGRLRELTERPKGPAFKTYVIYEERKQ